jgi:predicted nucleotidyltransferase
MIPFDDSAKGGKNIPVMPRGAAPPAEPVQSLADLLYKDADWDLFDWVNMIEELKGIFEREVDLVEKTTLRNLFRRHYILNTQKIIYAT